MKKNMVLFLVIIMIFSLVGCTSKANTDKVAEIKKAGKLVIGTSAAYPPFEFHAEIDGKDQIVGFDIDIAKELAKDLGVELEIKDMQFAGLLAALNAGKIDIVVAGVTPTEERKKSVDFSKMYYTVKQAVIVKKGKEKDIKSIEDIKDMKISVQKGTTQEQIAKDYLPESQIKALGKISDSILELKNDKVEGVIAEDLVAKAYVKNNSDLTLVEVDIDEGDNGSAIAIKKGNEDLVEAINVSLDKMVENKMIEKFIDDAIEISDK
ncbi:transporter substrate-binding domain-containing protein [Lutibacter sp. B2]|nr:transporter substrate-binding domain-containing protein [Lutibacter sp. B2]